MRASDFLESLPPSLRGDGVASAVAPPASGGPQLRDRGGKEVVFSLRPLKRRNGPQSVLLGVLRLPLAGQARSLPEGCGGVRSALRAVSAYTAPVLRAWRRGGSQARITAGALGWICGLTASGFALGAVAYLLWASAAR